MGNLKNWNSCIYEAKVVHTRLQKYKTTFSYTIYTFLIDLDEIDELDKRIWCFSRNRWNLFSFYDQDHLQWNADSVQESILNYLKDCGYPEKPEKIYLLTNLRVLGYGFNPVSFYFIQSKDEKYNTIVAEVCNTFHEVKPYFFGTQPEKTEDGLGYRMHTKKLFYVSPFIDLDSEFEFKVLFPNEKLKIFVDSYENGTKTLATAYVGTKKPLSQKNLALFFLKYPLVTVKIIGAIHYRALVLFLKKLPYLKKADHPEKQTGVKLGKSNSYNPGKPAGKEQGSYP